MALFATQSQSAAFDQQSADRVDALRAQIDSLRERIEQFEFDRRSELANKRVTAAAQRLVNRLTVRLGSFLAVSTAVTATLVVLLRG